MTKSKTLKSNQLQPAQKYNLPIGYHKFLVTLKSRIRSAQLKAAVSVNCELVKLYWDIGQKIVQCQQQEGWGTKIIDRLAADLRRDFPEMKGFSPRNIKYMKAMAEAYTDEQFVQQVVAQIPWGHNVRILDHIKNIDERIWYIQKTIENGWSRSILIHQIESNLYHRQGKAVVNFERTLSSPQSELAQQILKDPYNFDFLTMGEKTREHDIEKGLLRHIRDFLLELGIGFAFIGNQVRIDVGGEEFYIDLLLYHLRLRCYVIIELKACDFIPEFAGKMNFYLSAVDDLLRHADDAPSIGIILCKSHNKVIAEYALRDTNKPIGVASYKLTRALPQEFKETLPTIEELENELSSA